MTGAVGNVCIESIFEYDCETHFDFDDLSIFIEINFPKLFPEQRIVNDMIMPAITNKLSFN